ncbi:MAG: hypothetical protein O7H41_05535 [Planctomycetota bacterium]|nr:hypothetical protein [Planctomycetota bacterium]
MKKFHLNPERGTFLFALTVSIPIAAIALGAYAERSLRNMEAAQRYRADAAALHVAKGGVEKALLELDLDPDWRAGFSNAALASGTYSVTVEDDSTVPALSGLVRIRSIGTAVGVQGNSVQAVAVMASTEAIETIAGNGDSIWNGDGLAGTDTAIASPYGLAMDPSGNLWFTSESRIRKWDQATGTISTPVGSGYGSILAGDDVGDGGPMSLARFNDPRGISFSPDGKLLYIADAGNGLVRTANVGPDVQLHWGFGMAQIPLMPGNIDRLAGGTPLGFSGDSFYASLARFGADLNGATVDSNGVVFVSDASNQRVRAINTGLFPVIIGAVVIPAGWIATVYGNGTTSYGFSGALGTTAGMSDPGPVTLDSSENVWVPLAGHDQVYRLDRTTGLIWHEGGASFASSPLDGGAVTSAGLGDPTGLALYSDGSWVLASTGYHTVRRIDTSGIIDAIAGRSYSQGFRPDNGPACRSLCDTPRCVVGDPSVSSEFFFTDQQNHRIRKVSRRMVVYNYTEG